MKKVLIAGLIAIGAMGSAQAHGPHGSGRPGSGWGWAGPALIAGIIGYEMGRPAPVVIQQPQVIYQQPAPVVIQQQPEVRVQPQYTPAYPAPYTISCTPAYTQQGQYIGCIR